MSEPVEVLLTGRHGDLLNVLPALHTLATRSAHPVRVIVSEPFAPTLEGASYVDPVIVPHDWIKGVPELATLHPHALIPQAWLSANPGHGPSTLAINGRLFRYDPALDPDYSTCMWRRLGLTRTDMLTLPLILDRRSPERESALLKPLAGNKRPVLLLNLHGPSSPFVWLPEVMNALDRFKSRVLAIDLHSIRAHRLHDLLGLYDIAHGLITVDTATLHLAPASRIPVAAFTANGWRGSTPRGNTVWTCRYSDTPARLVELLHIVESWLGEVEVPAVPAPPVTLATPVTHDAPTPCPA